MRFSAAFGGVLVGALLGMIAPAGAPAIKLEQMIVRCKVTGTGDADTSSLCSFTGSISTTGQPAQNGQDDEVPNCGDQPKYCKQTYRITSSWSLGCMTSAELHTTGDGSPTQTFGFDAFDDGLNGNFIVEGICGSSADGWLVFYTSTQGVAVLNWTFECSECQTL